MLETQTRVRLVFSILHRNLSIRFLHKAKLSQVFDLNAGCKADGSLTEMSNGAAVKILPIVLSGLVTEHGRTDVTLANVVNRVWLLPTTSCSHNPSSCEGHAVWDVIKKRATSEGC